MDNIYDLIMGSGPDARQTAQAMAQAIRGKQSGQALYALGAPDVPSALSKVYGEQAAEDQAGLMRGALGHAQFGEEQRNLKQALASLKNETDVQKAILGAGARMYGADSGLEGKLLLAQALGDRQQEKQQKADDSAWERYVNKTNAGLAGTRTVLGQDKNVIQRVDRTLGLIESKPWLTTNEVHDAYTALAGVLTGGSVAARGTIESISQSTVGMSASKALTWLDSNPRDAGAQLLIKRLAATLRTERDLAKARIAETVKNSATGMQELLRRKGKVAIDYHRGLGLPDDFLSGIGLDIANNPAETTSGAPSDSGEIIYRNRHTGERRYNKPGLSHPDWTPE